MAEAEIERLTQAAANGQRRAVDALVEHYLPQLRAFVRLRVDSALRLEESRSDLVQSVCREVIENAENFRFAGEDAFRKWLFTMALRKIGKRRRHYATKKRDVHRKARLVEDSDAALVNVYHSFTSPSRGAIAREEMARIENAFEHLSEEQREVVTMAHLLGMSRAEIAQELGKTEIAVRVTLHRALVKLSGLLTEKTEDGPPA